MKICSVRKISQKQMQRPTFEQVKVYEKSWSKSYDYKTL